MGTRTSQTGTAATEYAAGAGMTTRPRLRVLIRNPPVTTWGREERRGPPIRDPGQTDGYVS